MDAVLDTNVLVSGLINPSGAPGRIVDFLRSGQLRSVVDDRILAEYHDVLRRSRFERYFSETAREDVLEYLSKNSLYTFCSMVVSGLPDPGDVPFLEVALTEQVVLATGNIKYFPRELALNCIILTPAEFIAEIGGIDHG